MLFWQMACTSESRAQHLAVKQTTESGEAFLLPRSLFCVVRQAVAQLLRHVQALWHAAREN